MNGQTWLFKWRQFEAEIIVCAVRWYLRYSLSYRVWPENSILLIR
jgi:transposase-like protein